MWRLVQRPTPYEVCDALKAEVANARRPLRWQADMAEELEELAEREQRCMELREDARHALDDVKRTRGCPGAHARVITTRTLRR